MAKSLKSKFKRKMRGIARERKAPKIAALLDQSVAKRAAFDLLEAEKTKAKKEALGGSEEQSMETEPEKSTLNLTTMKTADGKYPGWFNQRKQKRLQKKLNVTKKTGKKNGARCR